MEINGTIHEIFKTQTITERFKKREFVLSVTTHVNDNAYVDLIKFQVTNNKIPILDNVHKGDDVTVMFNIGGRRYEKDGNVGYFNTLTAWRIEKSDDTVSEHDDDLPF